jgi:hypothetical protein
MKNRLRHWYVVQDTNQEADIKLLAQRFVTSCANNFYLWIGFKTPI